MNTTTIKIIGITPLIMHNGQLADPLNAATKALAALTSKRNKTDEDHLAVRKCEWYGSIYVNAVGAPCLPGEVLEAALIEGARKYKLGKSAEKGVVVANDYAIEYDGPKTADGLWAAGGFIKTAGVKVNNGRSRIIRSRPIFPQWACTFDVHWDTAYISNEDKLFEVVKAAGMNGIGDWRPKFGRFEIEQ